MQHNSHVALCCCTAGVTTITHKKAEPKKEEEEEEEEPAKPEKGSVGDHAAAFIKKPFKAAQVGPHMHGWVCLLHGVRMNLLQWCQ